MDFSNLTKKLQRSVDTLKEKTQKSFSSVIKYGADKIAHSSATIQKKEDLEAYIAESKQTSFTDADGNTKYFSHTVFLLTGEEKTKFFEDAVIEYPVLAAKAFSANTKVKLAPSKLLKDYNVTSLPALLVFRDEKLLKKIEGEENIEKITKSFTMDIVAEIEKL